ncbi:hypothetical protein DSCA_59570 [Desulfosarcina alkanivorans]|uniref:Potassium channel domain-containing protein n=1 Tax=Desulfosarcina alkanivorans TaxID=571177 RepID=A0A5K7Z624_9BACT|nr:potassium channel family protein [Desulfosarcina alkanivorans]BBO72027.1 hypothetical protein DSCA_59570 [Desulfosarcina alkanivorans]
MKLNSLTRNNVILLACLLALLFLFPLFRERDSLVRDLILTAVLFSGIFSLDFSARTLKILLPLGTATAATTWINHFVENDLAYLIDFISTFLFLVAIVVLMIRHIARSRHVTPTIILSAINGYLLLGVLGGVLLGISDAVHRHLLLPESRSIIFPGESVPQFNDFIYFSFVTLSTLGYGDVTPASHLSRSIAILIAITGQLYMTILIAMLIGKFLARSEGK